MRTFIILTFLVLLPGITAAYPHHSLHWNARTLVFFLPEDVAQQRQLMKEVLFNQCQLTARDVDIYLADNNNTSPKELLVNKQRQTTLPDNFHALKLSSPDYQAVLIGKDGEVKHRWQHAIDWQELNTIIDAMPMRKREIQNGQRRHCNI
ncbi:DUF4174 domain-containing protein [Thaumasiovibrio subtropicus]|uniref:DUF4174 domain-containing protein n=1 Tax=Thaumasiovibrio subtropicus TaxID=1891207 RepID=UPI000B361B6F|nr:DUF4174 domain-containing protein [Thaumasiovibrio subtropicus]